MKQILIMALAITGFGFFSAEAQTKSKEVCRISKSGAACYSTKYAENFKVCEDNRGYHICGEVPTYANSTRGYAIADYQEMSYTSNNNESVAVNTNTPEVMVAPQSQSYPVVNVSIANTYEGYYPKKHYILVGYGDNVAADNRAPYEGLPSPQYDGPEKNAERNMNVNTPNTLSDRW